jgi:hypothetical protein
MAKTRLITHPEHTRLLAADGRQFKTRRQAKQAASRDMPNNEDRPPDDTLAREAKRATTELRQDAPARKAKETRNKKQSVDLSRLKGTGTTQYTTQAG